MLPIGGFLQLLIQILNNWRFSAASYPDLEQSIPVFQNINMDHNAELDLLSGGDINLRESYLMNRVIDAHLRDLNEEDSSGLRSHTLSILLNNVPGVLNLVTGVIAIRSYNIQSLAGGNSGKEEISRFIIVVPGTSESISKLVQDLYELKEVHEVVDLTHLPFVERELMLIKVALNTAVRRNVLDIPSIFRATVVDVSDHTITLELTGDLYKMVAL